MIKHLFVILALALASRPLLAQMDFSGEWTPRIHEDFAERIPGPDLGDYLGLPINAAARMRADTWDASIQTLPEWQCRPHSSDYVWRGPSSVRISKEVDPVSRELIAFHVESLRSDDRVIYMDGRPHPPEWAAHTWSGFSTGKWDGKMLTISTTHLKEGYIRRNGLARSDRATTAEHWIRHGDFMTVMTIVTDPVYLTEPFVRTTDFGLQPTQQLPPYPCDMVQEIKREKGLVPHHLPGTNLFLNEFAERAKLPPLVSRGGAATMYPEYRSKLSTPPQPNTDDAPRLAQRPVVVDDGQVHALQVRGSIYMLVGAGGNITVDAAPNGLVLLVDSGKAVMADKVLAALRQITPKPIHKIINTNVHPDHTGGNEKLVGSSSRTPRAEELGLDETAGTSIISHENVLKRMAMPGTQDTVASSASWPTETYFVDELRLSEKFNGEAIQVVHPPAAHSDGDSMVWFRRSDVIATGDVFVTDSFPLIDLARGGSLQGIIDALNRILDIAMPASRVEGGTMIVPGHGRLCDTADVAFYRDMTTIFRDRILSMIRKGMTLEQVKAARPTLDYDGLYGADSGNWTTDMFVEASYRSLSAKK
ncbi:MAG: MBL fold metallo-hydrolase [Acidobacteriota bacterium]|nr:MBL fold metallo-hydrolase [Acidobacteriota bacterium]